ncbi:MAG: PorT family protein, partial [Bacteroidetes bacterium]
MFYFYSVLKGTVEPFATSIFKLRNMKSFKLLTCLFVVFLFSGLNLQAQNHFGFRAGTNFAYVSTTEEGFITNERVLGLNAHLFFDLGLGDNLAFQPELGFIQKGYRRTITLTGIKRYAIKINYVDFAASLKYKFGSKNFKAHILAGPYFGLALSAHSKDLDDGDKNK